MRRDVFEGVPDRHRSVRPPADFDSRVDSTVRVQTGRLRSKLAEYYAGEGAADRLVIEIPKGAYSLTYHIRPPVETPAPTRRAIRPPVPARSIRFPGFSCLHRHRRRGRGDRAPHRDPFHGAAPAVGNPQPAPALKAFWGAFASGPDAPLVVYSNAEFVGRPETGLRYFKPGLDAGKPIMDHYTGVGEVMAVHDLDQVFASLKHEMRIKRGRLLTWDDAKTSDLIFIGSPSENLSLRELARHAGFRVHPQTLRPPQGRPDDFQSASRRLRAGHVSRIGRAHHRGLCAGGAHLRSEPSRRVLILAGITTFGTQAAVEFVCRASAWMSCFPKAGPLGAPACSAV
jgi:hypothetical protein